MSENLLKMSEHQNYMLIVQEELGELAMELIHLQQTISKTMRFGMAEQRPGYKTNIERIQDEFNDVLGSLVKLRQYGIDLAPDCDKIVAKAEKVTEYTGYSKKLGVIL